MTRPRAADDFTVIRARMEELRRERAGAVNGDDMRGQQGKRPSGGSGSHAAPRRGGLSPELRRALLRGRLA